MSELICVDGKFNAEVLSFYSQHGVVTPEEGKLYNPRSINKNSNGEWEILLEELVNPEVPIKHPILGVAYKEAAWRLSRFAKIDGSQLYLEEVVQMKKDLKLVEQI